MSNTTPEGYTELSYIESTGTQYIDTGLKPNQNYKVEIKARSSQPTSSDYVYLLGADSGYKVSAYTVTTWTATFGTNGTDSTFNWADGADHTIIFDKGALSVDGATKWTATATVQTAYNMYLMSANRSGTAKPFIGRVYWCKIYNGDELVRDYVPAQNDSGAAGLYDKVAGKFYTNAGAGTITAGPIVATPTTPHGTTIDGILRNITSGACTVNGITYPIAYGKTNIGGIIYTIPFGGGAETIETYPTATGTLTYTGSAQSPSWTDYDDTKMTIGGTTSATNAGSYTATFTPKDGYVWSDGSSDAYSLTWTIGKAMHTLKLGRTSVRISVYVSMESVSVTTNASRITASSSNTTACKAQNNGTNAVNIYPNAVGSAIVTVATNGDSNYNGTSATIAVTVYN